MCGGRKGRVYAKQSDDDSDAALSSNPGPKLPGHTTVTTHCAHSEVRRQIPTNVAQLEAKVLVSAKNDV